jgi:hypothetical protein
VEGRGKNQDRQIPRHKGTDGWRNQKVQKIVEAV